MMSNKKFKDLSNVVPTRALTSPARHGTPSRVALHVPLRSHLDSRHARVLVQDSFFHWKFAVAPCAVLGVIVNTWDLGFKGFFNILNVSVKVGLFPGTVYTADISTPWVGMRCRHVR